MICKSLTECFLVDVRRIKTDITVWRCLKLGLTEARVLAVVLLRIIQYYGCKRFLWRFTFLLRRINEILTGFECHPSATIGEGLLLAHTQNLVIGEGVKIGKNVTIYNGVTIGALARGNNEVSNRYPTVGDGVIIYTGAKILGKINIGNSAIIGANAVVLNDIPAMCVAVGVPARILPKRGRQ